MSEERKDLKISKLLGEPINEQKKTPVEISAIADEYTAEPGEHVWRLKNIDTTVDIVFDVDANGKITPVKRTPLNDVLLQFKGLNSKKEYVLVDEILNSVDVEALARRKESITRGMDKKELKMIIDAIATPHADYYPENKVANAGVTIASGEDLYDAFLKAKHALEDQGDTYVALVGTTVKEKIDSYSKENATSDNYDVKLAEKLKEWGIETVKIFGKVADVAESESKLLDAKKFILVAKNSRLAKGKPIAFCRRRITPAIATQMGADVDTAQRAIFVGQVPTTVDFSGVSSDVLAYSVFGYESIIFCITNPSAIVVADCTAIL
jgi:hypothetical protein